MSSMDPNEIPSSSARRHFLGVAAATGARVAGITAATMAIVSSPARAMGRNWGPRGGGHGGGAGGDGSGHGGSGSSGGGGGANCLLRSTLISTPAGSVAIEQLQAGCMVLTVSGDARPIRWIGRQTFRRNRSSWSEAVLPVCISKDALADGMPSRDLYVSQGHAIFLDGVLIRAKALVNGRSIVRAIPDTETVEYYNIMLDGHDAVMAEATPVETFQLFGDDYEKFDNFVEIKRLYPSNNHPTMSPFAPVVGEESGRQHLKALLLLGVWRFIPTRDPFADVTKRVTARAGDPVA
jgi:hypothetical protein